MIPNSISSGLFDVTFMETSAFQEKHPLIYYAAWGGLEAVHREIERYRNQCVREYQENYTGFTGSVRAWFDSIPDQETYVKTRLKNYVNQQSFGGYTAVHAATLAGKLPIIQRLQELGADLTIPNKDGYTVLHMAARNNFPTLIDYFLEHGLAIDTKGEYGRTPLHIACFEGCVEAVQHLLRAKRSHPFDVNSRTTDTENTPLHDAVAHASPSSPGDETAKRKFLDITQWLLQYGADLYAKNKANSLVIHEAIYGGNPEVVRIILDRMHLLADSEIEQPLTEEEKREIDALIQRGRRKSSDPDLRALEQVFLKHPFINPAANGDIPPPPPPPPPSPPPPFPPIFPEGTASRPSSTPSLPPSSSGRQALLEQIRQGTQLRKTGSASTPPEPPRELGQPPSKLPPSTPPSGWDAIFKQIKRRATAAEAKSKPSSEAPPPVTPPEPPRKEPGRIPSRPSSPQEATTRQSRLDATSPPKKSFFDDLREVLARRRKELKSEDDLPPPSTADGRAILSQLFLPPPPPAIPSPVAAEGKKAINPSPL